MFLKFLIYTETQKECDEGLFLLKALYMMKFKNNFSSKSRKWVEIVGNICKLALK